MPKKLNIDQLSKVTGGTQELTKEEKMTLLNQGINSNPIQGNYESNASDGKLSGDGQDRITEQQ